MLLLGGVAPLQPIAGLVDGVDDVEHSAVSRRLRGRRAMQQQWAHQQYVAGRCTAGAKRIEAGLGDLRARQNANLVTARHDAQGSG